MKKFVTAIVLALGLCAFAAMPASAASETREAEITYRSIKIVLDGREICPKDAAENEVEPFILDGTTYLPVRAVADALGLDVRWRSSDSTVLLTRAGDEHDFFSVTSVDLPPELPRKTESAQGHNAVESVTLSYRDIRLLVDGVVIRPKDAAGNTVEPFILNGTTYLPVRAVADALGLAVDWDAASATVRLSHWLETRFYMELRDSSGELNYQRKEEYEYDTLGRLTYNVYGNNTSMGGRTHILYDEAGRLVEYSTDQKNMDSSIWCTDTIYNYSDESGLCVSAEIKNMYFGEPKWHTGSAKFEYDEFGRLIRAEESLYGGWAEWSYDEAGRVIELREKEPDYTEDPGTPGAVTVRKYTYDEHGRLVAIDYDGVVSECLTYDEDGRELSYTSLGMNLSSVVTVKSYDENGRLIRMELSYNGKLTRVTEYSYSETGQLIRKETVDIGDNETYRSVEVYTYDENGNVIQRELTDAGHTTTMTYEYVMAGV